MTTQLTYAYSGVDKEPCFGVWITGYENWEAYPRWVWFYMGQMLGKREITIYPYSVVGVINGGKVLKTYKHQNDAQKQAKLLVEKIKKHL